MKNTDVQIICGCTSGTVCPQNKVFWDRQCVIVVPEDDLFRIVMQLPEFKRRYTVSNTKPEPERNFETGKLINKDRNAQPLKGTSLPYEGGAVIPSISRSDRECRRRALEQAVIYCRDNPLKDVVEQAKSFEKFLAGGNEE